MGRFLTVLVMLAALGAGCNDAPPTRSESPSEGVASDDYRIELQATPATDTAVDLTITTNIPLPIEVMASVNLSGQAPEDIAIGYSERVTLTAPTTSIRIETANGREPLPAGDYDAEVAFYPRWGAEDNPGALRAGEQRGAARVNLAGSGQSSAAADLENRRQAWVMDNVFVHTPWDEDQFVRELGPYERARSELNNHDAYYFPGADMTIFVNRTRQDVGIWRIGREVR